MSRSRQCFSIWKWRWTADIGLQWKGCVSMYIGASHDDDEDSESSKVISMVRELTFTTLRELSTHYFVV